MTELDRLTSLAPPPPAVPPNDWEAAHAALGFALPADFRALSDLYGAGRFRSALTVHAPGALTVGAELVSRIQDEGGYLVDNRAEAGARWRLDVELRPIAGGLVLLADFDTDSGCRAAYWQWTHDDPDRWPIVVLSGELRPRAWSYEGSATAFVADFAEGRLEIPFGGKPDLAAAPFKQFPEDVITAAPRGRRRLFGR